MELDYWNRGRMPSPMWTFGAGTLEEPLDTMTAVSEDIWKKFDLAIPLDKYSYHPGTDLFDDISSAENYEKGSSCQHSREIRHHDCMWAGLCISKEHSRTHPTKRDNTMNRKVPAGRSLLIPKTTNVQSQQNQQPPVQQQQQHQQHQQPITNQHHSQRPQHQACHMKNLESDGDSTRPETPQSSDSDSESDDDQSVPYFKHEAINITEKLSECMSLKASTAMPVSEVTGQLVRTPLERRKTTEDNLYQNRNQVAVKQTEIRNTLSDHCYHLNQQPIGKNLDHLGVQTPSDSGESVDSEEEIDVVSFEKPCLRPAAVLPTVPSQADQHHFQQKVKTAFKEQTVPITSTPPRPRGRPPSNATKKRLAAQALEDEKPPKRQRHRPYQRRTKVSKISQSSSVSSVSCSPPHYSSSSRGNVSPSRTSSDDEPDTEKRSMHNNMERQRRIELRNAFEDLRVLVPEVEAKEKAPKVAILRQAAVYCDMLTETGQLMSAKAIDLKRRQEKLRARLSQLRRSFAFAR